MVTAELCGLHQHTVKAIDKRRLESLYFKDEKLVKPKHYARYLGIDEFKLHDGHQYATHIIDMATGHVLWIAQGKKIDKLRPEIRRQSGLVYY